MVLTCENKLSVYENLRKVNAEKDESASPKQERVSAERKYNDHRPERVVEIDVTFVSEFLSR